MRSYRRVHCVMGWASLPRPTTAFARPLTTTTTTTTIAFRHHSPNRLLSRSHQPYPLTPTTQTRTMSSDDAYMSFLNKANADLSAGQQQQPQSQETSTARTQTVDANNQNQIPASLQSIDAFYVSETDEPFEPVVLGWEGAKEGVWPSHSHLSSLISETDLSSSITTLSSASFDPRDEYAGVLRAVKEAASGGAGAGKESAVEVKVYRVEIGRSRVEYFVLGLDGEKGRVVGFKANAVET